ncbi:MULTISPECIES: hypothetical protein, partial [unclassified Pseudoalteromonas]|uniref:hypothetical protein n=1 Tax=unclassified Pseudoalteromonas TaxID=194690 RepID=UPI00235A3EA9
SMSRLLTLILACRFGVKFSGEFNYTLSSCCLFFIPQRSTRPNSGLIKLSTVHSYKGLESKTVFYLMDEKDTAEIVYTSITRTVENLIILDKSKQSQFSEFFKSEMGENT